MLIYEPPSEASHGSGRGIRYAGKLGAVCSGGKPPLLSFVDLSVVERGNQGAVLANSASVDPQRPDGISTSITMIGLPVPSASHSPIFLLPALGAMPQPGSVRHDSNIALTAGRTGPVSAPRNSSRVIVGIERVTGGHSTGLGSTTSSRGMR